MRSVGERLLAAIMFTDMVGYTALMQKDERQAKANRDRHRRVLKNTIEHHKGKILQYYGDGTLSIFNSAIEAVQAAIQIQHELQKAPIISLRIGLHIGDIVYDEEGIYGDGVNIASRIENLAPSGSVLVSEKVYDEVKNHPEFIAQSLGFFELKNVKKPVEVYSVSDGGLTMPSAEDIKSQRKEAAKGLAVLPFVNMSPDPENEYFSDGITEELLNVLAKVEGLQVTARTSSFAYKGRNEDVKKIGEQLGAKYILEGSVRKAASKVRITAQLVNTSDGYHIWSETFDRILDDIFEVQDEIALKITNKLREKLTLKPEKESFVKPRTSNIEAYNTYLKGLFYSNKWTLEDAEKAMSEFEKAIRLEPEFSLPYVGMAGVHIYLGASGKRAPEQIFPRAKEYALKALALDDQAAESHWALASVYFYHEWAWDKALESLNRAIVINPSYADAYLLKAMWYSIHGRSEEAIPTMRKSIELDPFNAPAHFAYAAILLFAGQPADALAQLDRLYEITPKFPDALSMQAGLHLMLGNTKKAQQLYLKLEKIPGYEALAYAGLGSLHQAMQQPEEARKYLEKLYEAGKTKRHQDISYYLACLHAELGDTEAMFQQLEKSVEAKYSTVVYLDRQPSFFKYHDDPRFKELQSKIGISR